MLLDTRLSLAGFVVLAGCTFSQNMNNKEAETAIGDFFNKTYPVETVKCDKTVPLKAGTNFRCKLRFKGTTEELTVSADITEVKDQRGIFSFKVVEPIFDPKILEQKISEGVKAQTGADAKVECGAPRAPKANDSCKMTNAAGTVLTVALHVAPDGQLKSWEVMGVDGKPVAPPADGATAGSAAAPTEEVAPTEEEAPDNAPE